MLPAATACPQLLLVKLLSINVLTRVVDIIVYCNVVTNVRMLETHSITHENNLADIIINIKS